MADAEQSAASTEQQERKEEQPAAEESSAATGSNKPLPSGVAEDEEAALPEVPMSEVDLEQDGPAAAENGKNGHSDQVAPASVPSQPRSSISSASSPPPSIPSSARLTRSDTIASSRTSTGSIAASRKPLLQGVLVITSFETILNSKDAKRIPPLKAAAQKALDLLRAPNAVSPDEDKREEVFEPLRLACETRTNALMITALDTIGKLVSYGFFNPPTTAEEQGSEDVSGDSSRFDGADSMVRDEKSERLSDAVVDTICNCFVDIPSGPVAAATSSVTGASGADAVNLQIVKALLTLVLQDAGGKGLSVHQSSLLKAVRTVYNIFLLSKSPTNQMVAQGALNQIVGSVFTRVKPDTRLATQRVSSGMASPRPPNSRESSSSNLPEQIAEEADTEAALEGPPVEPSGRASHDASGPDQANGRRSSVETIRPESEQAGRAETSEASVPTIAEPTQERGNQPVEEDNPASTSGEGQTSQDSAPIPEPLTLSKLEAQRPSLEHQESATGDGLRTPGPSTPTPFYNLNELHTKDAYLVFRALCKLGMKPLGVESERDMKSHAMRSKLLSLHLVLTILHTHMPMLVDPNVVIYSTASREFTPFIQAVKQYLLLCLSRNAVSSVLSVFELSCEIFWRVLSGMRMKLKKEIEVLINEIFLPILEMRNSSVRQKAVLLNVFSRLCLDPQALVEMYINYDCDRTSIDNVYERLVNIISRISTTNFTTITPANVVGHDGKASGKDPESSAAGTASWATAMPFLPQLPTAASTSSTSVNHAEIAIQPLPSLVNTAQPLEVQLKRQSLDCLVSILRSLVAWAGRGSAISGVSVGPYSANGSSSALDQSIEEGLGHDSPSGGNTSRNSEDDADRPESSGTNGHANGSSDHFDNRFDDPTRFETAKMRKTTLLEGIKKFNFKPKRGIAFLLETGFIRSRQPKDIAAFLLHADGLNKAMIGEYLGEGDPDSVATMHAFVDFMDFTQMPFTDALRMFLQSFRLPGEAQKIDRYMLKFAERYIAGNPNVFANADTAYILAFSTIMLNTDAHSPQIKKGRMTPAEFIKNNRGINNGQDLPEEFLINIYNEIHQNEIRMKDEIATAAATSTPPASGLANALSTVGRDLQREAYVLQSEGMASKTEALFRTMVKTQRRAGAASRSSDVFFSASHIDHVRPMFEVVWMPLLAGISGPLQDSEEADLIDRSLTGFKQAIKIVCLFDLELERNAFVTTLAKFTFLNDYSEMRPKNVEAIRCMLDIAAVSGSYLKGSWREVIICVSQLEKFQLITKGIDSRAMPELGRKHSSKTDARSNAQKKQAQSSRPTDEVAAEASSSHVINAADRIFASSSTLSGSAIVDFVRALSEISWEEIQASGLTEHPRVFCLQKLVEISYYNMNRIRLEWSQMWNILGEHFNQVCSHTNANVSFLALDSLRQLAMRFLEKQELTNFNFQKDFLKPFEYAMIHNNNADVRDMILQCLQQMIQARVANLRSGWRTMFGVFCAASRVSTERVAIQAFEIVKHINKEHFSLLVSYGSFADLAVCMTDFCKVSKYQKISLHAIEMLRGLIRQMLQSPDCPINDSPAHIQPDDENVLAINATPTDDPMTKYWFPVLFGFYDIVMNGEDLEVRKRALDYLFGTLKQHGHTFPPKFWDSVCKEVLFPIFAVLRSRSDVSRFSTHEDMSVWLSTTMIQALRDLVDLFAHYFDVLVRMLDQLLDLLVECICQENDTLARIGTSCLQQLLEKNVRKLTPPLWEKIVTTFVQLFQTTTAGQLFDENLRMPIDPDAAESPSASNPNVADTSGFVHPTPLPGPNGSDAGDAEEDLRRSTRPLGFNERRRIFRQIIVKCVLQLLLIETAHDLLQNEEVYSTIPPADLLRLMAELDNSYRFAKRFNADKELRMALWKVGFMKQLPNLLKQESSSAATLVNVLLRMYADVRPDHVSKRGETIQAFLPLGVDIIEGYISLDAESQARNISAWTPVVAEVLQGVCSWEDEVLRTHVSTFYPLAVDLLARDMTPEIRESVRSVFHRIGLSLNIFTAESSE